jgi:hypothetical protein
MRVSATSYRLTCGKGHVWAVTVEPMSARGPLIN